MYVVFWSSGLFVATFYAFFGEFSFANMKDMTAFDMTKNYLLPLFTAMALFLLDAQYVMFTEGRQITASYSACFILFILATVASMLTTHFSDGFSSFWHGLH